MMEEELIEREMKISMAIDELILRNGSPHAIQHLRYLHNIVGLAIEGDERAIGYLNRLGSRKHISFPEKYIDDYGNIFEIKGIKESILNDYWKKFDLHYTGSMEMRHYLHSLRNYIRVKSGFHGFNIKKIKE